MVYRVSLDLRAYRISTTVCSGLLYQGIGSLCCLSKVSGNSTTRTIVELVHITNVQRLIHDYDKRTEVTTTFVAVAVVDRRYGRSGGRSRS